MEPHHMIKLIGLLVISAGFISSCYGYTFHVGAKDGWVVDPRESYNHWAERNRFQVNDTLVFKYKKGLDSVLVVNEEAYHTCNNTSPKETLNDGNSDFKFKRSGPFFFISGQGDRCENGQKLFIIVMAVRHHNNSTNNVHSSTTAAPALAPESPVQAPSTVPNANTYTPAPAPAPEASAVASTVFGIGGWIGLILCLGLTSVYF